MRIMPIFKKQGDSFQRTNAHLKRGMGVVLLVALLQFGSAAPAHAQLATIDVGAIAQAVTTNANIAITNANLLLMQMQHSLKSQIEAMMAILQKEAMKRMAQAQMDNAARLAQAQELARLQNEYTMSQKSQACAIARVQAAAEAQANAENGAAKAIQVGVINRGIGGPESGTSAAAARRLAILNWSGILGTTRTGGDGNSPINSMPNHHTLTGDDQIYEDADLDMNSVLNPKHTSAAKVDEGALQYTMPSTMQVINGYTTFGDLTSTPPTGDALAYVAAYAYCDSLVPDLPNPTHGKHLTSGDFVNIMQDRANASMRSGLADVCFKALRYRTACPASSAASFQNANGLSCHTIQVQMCKLMKTPAPNGLGMDATRPSLANCETNGLSRAEYDRLFANRCNDTGFLQTLHSIFTARDAEHFMNFECPMMQDSYERKMSQERKDLIDAQAHLEQLRGSGSSASVTDRPVGSSTTTP